MKQFQDSLIPWAAPGKSPISSHLELGKWVGWGVHTESPKISLQAHIAPNPVDPAMSICSWSGNTDAVGEKKQTL